MCPYDKASFMPAWDCWKRAAWQVQRQGERRGLTLSPEKTHIIHIDEGFDFLGQHLRKYRGTYLAQPAKKAQNERTCHERQTGIFAV